MTDPLVEKQDKRIFYGWWIVAVSTLGISVGLAPFLIASLGLFTGPFHQEFGWNRAEISALVPALAIATMIAQPLLGGMIDKWGTRRILVPSMIAYGLGIAAIPAVVSELWHMLAIFVFVGSIGSAANTLPYMKVVSSWFNERRGIAIGLSVSGIGLGYAYVPVLLQFLISSYGWRAAYYTLSAIVLGLVIPLIVLVVRDSPSQMGLKPLGEEGTDSGQTDENRPGMTAAQACHTTQFWLLSTIFLCIAFVLHGILPHLVPMVLDKGIDGPRAATIASVMGVTVFFSRILIGYLLDRFFAPRVAAVFFALSILGLALLSLADSSGLLFLAAIMIGLSLGAEIDLLAYLTGKYFGVASFGKIYGLLFISVLLGSATGPLAFGVGYESMSSYSGTLTLAIFLNLIAFVLTNRLPQYSAGADATAPALTNPTN